LLEAGIGVDGNVKGVAVPVMFVPGARLSKAAPESEVVNEKPCTVSDTLPAV
jgi:hypothetical protein